MNGMKRFFAWFMILSLALGVVPVTVFADSEGAVMAGSGTEGDHDTGST